MLLLGFEFFSRLHKLQYQKVLIEISSYNLRELSGNSRIHLLSLHLRDAWKTPNKPKRKQLFMNKLGLPVNLKFYWLCNIFYARHILSVCASLLLSATKWFEWSWWCRMFGKWSKRGSINPVIFSVKLLNKTKSKTSSLITQNYSFFSDYYALRLIQVLEHHFYLGVVNRF